MGIKVIKKTVAGTVQSEQKKPEPPVAEIAKDAGGKVNYTDLMKKTQDAKKAKALKEEPEMTNEEADAFVENFIGKDDAPFQEEEEEEEEELKYTPLKKATKVKAKDAVGMVSKTFKDGSVVDEIEVVKAGIMMSDPTASVSVSCGLTRNLGNYESLKFQVTLSVPCTPDADDIEATYTEVRAWVDAKVDEINAEVSSDLGDA